MITMLELQQGTVRAKPSVNVWLANVRNVVTHGNSNSACDGLRQYMAAQRMLRPAELEDWVMGRSRPDCNGNVVQGALGRHDQAIEGPGGCAPTPTVPAIPVSDRVAKSQRALVPDMAHEVRRLTVPSTTRQKERDLNEAADWVKVHRWITREALLPVARILP
ncbi:MAG: hypothetical protein Q4D79_02320 [Propionibacteriaceae bacterium]|nr:hypothetical protein [Propionibacteriaceae bacterium]